MGGAMTVGFEPSDPLRDPPRPKQLRLLWRMRGPKRIVAAGLYEHTGGTELRVYFEPEDRDDVLQPFPKDSKVRSYLHRRSSGILRSSRRAPLCEAEYRRINGVTDTPCKTIEAATTTSVISASIRAVGSDSPCDSE